MSTRYSWLRYGGVWAVVAIIFSIIWWWVLLAVTYQAGDPTLGYAVWGSLNVGVVGVLLFYFVAQMLRAAE